MLFEFTTCHYTYAYRPKVEVFRKTFIIVGLKALKEKNPIVPVTLYKILIKDYVYFVFRLR